MTLAAAVRAAVGASRSIEDRRAGREPSAQEPEDVARADLAALCDEVSTLVVRLRLHAVAAAPTPETAVLLAFEDLTLVEDLGRAVRRAHQKLLSLYPAVPEDVVEEARRLAVVAGGEVETGHPALGDLARRTAAWLGDVQETLGD